MMLFLPIEQELDCINGSGQILGKIKFDGYKDEYSFHPENTSRTLTAIEEASIVDRLAGLASGKYSIAMQDDD